MQHYIYIHGPVYKLNSIESAWFCVRLLKDKDKIIQYKEIFWKINDYN